MGNAPSADEMTRAEALQQQLAELERAAQKLSSSTSASHAYQQQQQHPVLPHQLHVDGAVISTRAGVRVVVGPVVGKVDCSSARILLEVNTDALVTCHVSVLSTLSEEMRELPQCQLSVRCAGGRPVVFHISHLLPGRDYKFSFGGIDKQDVQTRNGGFRTPSLETSSSVHAVAVSGNNLYDLERCEANLWRDVKQLVEQKQALLVVHLGGQVVMERMFDQSCALLMRHASVTCKAPDWQKIEAQAMEILRSAYRTQWNAMPEYQFVLAHASNLMIWSDMDVYPAFTTRREFYIDHEKPTIQVCSLLYAMQVIRTVTRCARRLYHEYQRQLWDDHMDELCQREKELFSVAEKALASTAQIYQLTQQIPLVQNDLELQKKRHEIEGARRVEKHLRALEAEKAKAEKQLVSYNQLLAPQRGEEFVYCVGEIGFLLLDMRSTRLEPGGAQAAENDLMSNVQWEFVEKSFESSSKVRLWIVCSELPVVGEIAASEDLVTADSNGSTLKVNPELQSWWGRSPEAQARLLEMLFDWKMQQPNREFVLLSGASSLGFGGKSLVRDTKMRTKAEQYIVGAITASAHGENSFTLRKTWTVHERFEVEHSEITQEKAFVTLSLDTTSTSSSSTVAAASTRSLNPLVSGRNQIQIRQISTRHHAHEMARVLLGPVVGFVDDSSAVVLLEVDRDVDLICIATNPLTGEMRKQYQHFKAQTPNSFFWTHLRPEHYYQISFANIQNAQEFQASFSTAARFPSRLEVLALCHDDLLSVSGDGLGSASGTNNGDDHDATTFLWDSVADKTVNMPFARVNLTIHLGGQFCAKTNVFIDEALVLADATTVMASNQSNSRSNAEMVIEKLRQMYRLSWNLPGVREALAHGAHIMLSNRQDELELANSSTSDLIVRDLLDQVHREYQNLLLPPSKRVAQLGCKTSSTLERAKTPMSHRFGAFGIFFLPIGDFGGVTVHSATWDALRSFLSSPSVSVLILVTQEPIVEDSLEDVAEKARFDAAYRSKFGFYQRELVKLLELLFEWKRSASSESEAQAREVVFLSGSSHRSFDSVIQEVASLPVLKASPRLEETLNPGRRAPQVILQYVVGPTASRRASSSGAMDLEKTVFPQGTLFNRYSYHHFFTKKARNKLPQEQSEAVLSGGAGVNLLGHATGNGDQSSDESEALVSSQLAHLMVSIGDLGEVIQPRSRQQLLPDSTKPVPVVTRWSLICADLLNLSLPKDEDEDEGKDLSFENELDNRYRREGRIESHHISRAVNAWRLRPAQPSWLDELLSEALNEEESAQAEALQAYLQDKEQVIKGSFDQVAALKAGLVTLTDSRCFVPPLTEAFTAFYALSGSALRAMVGRSVPSPFVISYTIEQQLQYTEGCGEKGEQNLQVAAGCVDAALYELLVTKCVANSMIFQQRLKKRWE